MGLKQGKQPIVRFDKIGPFSMAGVSWVPKVVTFIKDNIAAAGDNDFWVAPVDVFIAQAFMVADVALDGTGTCTLGTDGDPDALIVAADLDPTTINNWATNIGSATAAAANGLLLPAGDTIRLVVGGTPTVGTLRGFFVYYELAAMFAEAPHFDIP